MTKYQIPEWATIGATVYGRESGLGNDRYRKGTITRTTATSVFARFNTAAGETGAEDRYTPQRGYIRETILEQYGSKGSHYTRTLVSEEEGLAQIARLQAEKERRLLRSAAQNRAYGAYQSLTTERAKEAIEALQAWLDQDGK